MYWDLPYFGGCGRNLQHLRVGFKGQFWFLKNQFAGGKCFSNIHNSHQNCLHLCQNSIGHTPENNKTSALP